MSEEPGRSEMEGRDLADDSVVPAITGLINSEWQYIVKKVKEKETKGESKRDKM